MKYNAILIAKYRPESVSKGFTKYAADFLMWTQWTRIFRK